VRSNATFYALQRRLLAELRARGVEPPPSPLDAPHVQIDMFDDAAQRRRANR